MRIDVLTIFPDLVASFASASVIGRGVDEGLLDIRTHDLRDAATDKHRT
ncbi:MAG: tRNA (guanine37-N1)-methyltransferase, partial [Acidimicrobiales bacterium]